MSEDQSENCSELRNVSPVIMRSPESSGQIVRQADSDEQLIALWLHGRPRPSPGEPSCPAGRDRGIIRTWPGTFVGEGLDQDKRLRRTWRHRLDDVFPPAPTVNSETQRSRLIETASAMPKNEGRFCTNEHRT